MGAGLVDRSECAVEFVDDCLDNSIEQEYKTAHIYVSEEYADETI